MFDFMIEMSSFHTNNYLIVPSFNIIVVGDGVIYFVDAFDQILGMLQNIAENLSRFEQYASMFKNRAMFQTALSLLY